MEIRILPNKHFLAAPKPPPDEAARAAAILCFADAANHTPPNAPLPPPARVLRLCFADTSVPDHPNAFRAETARAVRGFLDALPPDTRVLFVCCDAGQSRSAALAAAVLRREGRSDRAVWRDPRFRPNPLVYRLQCEAFGIRVPRLRLLLLERANRRAFARAVRASDRRNG